MGDKSQDTMGDNSTDPMDISAGEETETDFFSGVADFDKNLDHSMDSLQGSLNLPVFSLEQSNELQGSHGFHFSSMQKGQVMNQSDGSDGTKLEFVRDMYNQQQAPQGQAVQSLIHPAFRDDGNKGSFSSYIPHSSSLDETSAFITQGNFNIVTLAEQPFVTQGSGSSAGLSYTFSGDLLSSMVKTSGSSAGDKGGDGEEKAGALEPSDSATRNKSSPKGKGKKSRPTSSGGVDGTSKPEAQVNVLPSKVESTEPGNGETTFKPSLLEEILMEKKLALLKSPGVVRFLQTQQENLAREKAYMTRQTMDS